jgi:DNA-binding response OmpR family regulator
MHSRAEKLLVVESDDGLRDHIATVLSDAGYEVSTDYREGMKAVLGFDPEVVILGADPPKLDRCDLLSEIKGSDLTQNISSCDAVSMRTRRANSGAGSRSG